LHGNHLSVSAAGGTALDAEDRAQGGLAEGDHYLLAQLPHTVGQANRRGGLTFTGGGGGDGGDQDQLAVGSAGFPQHVVLQHGLVLAVLLQVFLVNPSFFVRLGNGAHDSFLCNLNVGFVAHDTSLLFQFFFG